MWYLPVVSAENLASPSHAVRVVFLTDGRRTSAPEMNAPVPASPTETISVVAGTERDVMSTTLDRAARVARRSMSISVCRSDDVYDGDYTARGATGTVQ